MLKLSKSEFVRMRSEMNSKLEMKVPLLVFVIYYGMVVTLGMLTVPYYAIKHYDTIKKIRIER